MIKFLDLNPEIFAIDINDLSIKIVKLRKKGDLFKIVSFREVRMEPGIVKEGVIIDQARLVQVLVSACSAVKGKKLGTKYVIVSLPEEKSFSQVIQMTNMTKEELKTAVPYEAENYIPLPIDKVYLDFQVIEEHSSAINHTDVLVNVIPRPIVDSYIETLKKAGLIPCILEIESQAIVRSLVKMGSKIPSTIFIDFGETKSSFTIVSGNSTRFTASLPISSRQLSVDIAEKLNLDFIQAENLKITYGLTLVTEERYDIKKIMEPVLNDLIAQVRRYISFYQGHVPHEYFSSEGKIEKIVLCGGGANLKGLPEFISSNLGIPVEIGNPLVNLTLPRNPKHWLVPPEKMLSLTTALGLALRGANYQNSEDGQIL